MFLNDANHLKVEKCAQKQSVRQVASPKSLILATLVADFLILKSGRCLGEVQNLGPGWEGGGLAVVWLEYEGCSKSNGSRPAASMPLKQKTFLYIF